MTLFVYSLLAFILSLGIVIFIMPFWIDYLKKVSFNQNVSEYSLQEYKDKAKTPIMGGVIFILVPVFLTILFNWNQLHSLRLWILLLSFVGYGLIGFVDDYLIVVKHNNDGLKPRYKFLLQVLLAIIFFLIYQREADLSITLLFSKRIIPLGIFYGPLVLLMFSGASNAVNLTDGMDGLAAGCMVTALVPFWIYALIQKEFGIAVFVAALLGALFGYLKFNIKPAKIFMGDTGSLALGAVLAALAMLLKKESLNRIASWFTLCHDSNWFCKIKRQARLSLYANPLCLCDQGDGRAPSSALVLACLAWICDHWLLLRLIKTIYSKIVFFYVKSIILWYNYCLLEGEGNEPYRI